MGRLSFSTIDGWWDEATHDADPTAAPIGFSIGTDLDYEDEALQDELDAASIYDVLENEIVPRFYDRDEHGVPDQVAGVGQAVDVDPRAHVGLAAHDARLHRVLLPARHRQVRAAARRGCHVRRATARATFADCARAGSNCASRWARSRARTKGHRMSRCRWSSATSSRRTSRVQLWVDDGVAPFALDATLVDRFGPRARYDARLDLDVYAPRTSSWPGASSPRRSTPTAKSCRD